jgi:hypothetical protein
MAFPAGEYEYSAALAAAGSVGTGQVEMGTRLRITTLESV